MFGKLSATSRQNPQGIGLGLNVCRRIVSVYDGTITMESELNKGSTFTFSLKVSDFKMRDLMSK